MTKLDVAIIASAIPARKKLLERSLYTWYLSMLKSGLDAKVYLYLEDKSGWSDFHSGNYVPDAFYGDIKLADRSGSHIAGYNYWIEDQKVDADVYLFTHPDLLFPSETVKVAHDLAIPDRFVGFKVFWIPEKMTDELDKYNWKQPETLEKEKDLFPLNYSDGHGDFYWNSDVRLKTEWHSTTTWSMKKETLAKLRPFPDFKMQGPDDGYFYAARRILGIEDYCVMNPVLFHQHHPQTWDQDSQLANKLAGEEIVKRFSVGYNRS